MKKIFYLILNVTTLPVTIGMVILIIVLEAFFTKDGRQALLGESFISNAIDVMLEKKDKR